MDWPVPNSFNMLVEAHRLMTLNDNFHSEFVSNEELALLGFYYNNSNITCMFCSLEIGYFTASDNLPALHLTLSPSCPLMIADQTDNIPIDSERLDRVVGFHNVVHNDEESSITNQISIEYIQEASELRRIRFGHILHRLDSFRCMPRRNTVYSWNYRKFATIQRRLNTFKTWPLCLQTMQDPEILSECGLLYTGKSDITTCFSCEIQIQDWNPTMMPWKQHVLANRDCIYLKLVKGDIFINNIIKEYDSFEIEIAETIVEDFAREAVTSTPINDCIVDIGAVEEVITTIEDKSDDSENENLNQSRLCRICFVRDFNVVVIPCFHVYGCAICMSAFDRCPCCNLPFENIKPLFMP